MFWLSIKQVALTTLPDGFLEIAASTADFATSKVSVFTCNGSPDGVFF
jgi:hypothetical protein